MKRHTIKIKSVPIMIETPRVIYKYNFNNDTTENKILLDFQFAKLQLFFEPTKLFLKKNKNGLPIKWKPGL
jgi:hypothetical protein